MKNLITAAIIAIAAQADTSSFEYAESIAKQAPAAEACIADTLEASAPSYYGEALGDTSARRRPSMRTLLTNIQTEANK